MTGWIMLLLFGALGMFGSVFGVKFELVRCCFLGDNIVAAFQRSQKTVFAVSKTPVEAQVFFEVEMRCAKIEQVKRCFTFEVLL